MSRVALDTRLKVMALHLYVDSIEAFSYDSESLSDRRSDLSINTDAPCFKFENCGSQFPTAYDLHRWKLNNPALNINYILTLPLFTVLQSGKKSKHIFFIFSRPIRIENFAEHYRIMSADSDFRFSEEFEELKHVGRDQPCTAADLPCNRPKNRFTNILPYDHSRFKLQPVDDEEGSDYINANYVPVSLSFLNSRKFTVTYIMTVPSMNFVSLYLSSEKWSF